EFSSSLVTQYPPANRAERNVSHAEAIELVLDLLHRSGKHRRALGRHKLVVGSQRDASRLDLMPIISKYVRDSQKRPRGTLQCRGCGRPFEIDAQRNGADDHGLRVSIAEMLVDRGFRTADKRSD